ncbi:MAG TPA: hypothetical protein VGP88_05405 [Thermoplasmata archaeon]|jgi:hypothetical protein|nr:hypothetical protein [Thermoplasmata archaeon]
MRRVLERSRLVPFALALAILGTVVAGALGPATGTVAAASSCQYGTCTSTGPGLLTYGVAAIVALIILLIAAALIYYRRRGGSQPPPSSGAGGVAAWEGPGGPESPAPGEVTPEYIEGPGDTAVAAGVAGAAVGGAVAAEAEPADIDSLMGELDRISGEILKRGPGKKGPGTAGGGDADSAPADS